MKFKKFIKILNQIEEATPEGILAFPSEESLRSLPKEDREHYLEYAMSTVAENTLHNIAVVDAAQEAKDQVEPIVSKPTKEVVPVIDTINSIIAQNLKRLDSSGEVLPVHELLKLANLSHAMQLPEE